MKHPTNNNALKWMKLSVCAFMVLFAKTAAIAADPEPVDFNRDIRQIFSNRCFKCHGPDEDQRKAGLRLDLRNAAVEELDSGETAIVPGDSGSSALYERVSTDDEDMLMPPADAELPSLSADEIDLIRRWIDEGAKYAAHWAFVAPTQPAMPPIQPHPDWADAAPIINPIDTFVRARLAEKELRPSPEATNAALIRRVSLDLTGLPPTPAEVDAFLADDSPDAYEKLVDRLLASSRYGEHMARYWLDLARYGDTHGLHLDNEREIWPYRDWVIGAFNRNLPYDQFTVEQLAGDLLPDATREQQIATGFCRCNISTGEGGAIVEEVYVRNSADRVETMATVFLGLTANCASCHDHKYDPLTQKEFYQFFAFFNSNEEKALDGNALHYPPTVAVPTVDQEQRKTEQTARLAEIRSQIKKALANVDYQDPSPDVEDVPLEPTEFVWIDDGVPEGAKLHHSGHEWTFVKKADNAPVFSGDKSHTRSGEGLIQHYFINAPQPLIVGDDDKLFAYVFIDGQNPPTTVQLQFHAGGASWSHRAHWGADTAHGKGGKDGSFFRAGDLPEAGKWVRLEVEAIQVGLKPGDKIDGWAFTQVGGTVHWDKAGLVTRMPQDGSQYESFARWVQVSRTLKKPPVPDGVAAAIKLDKEKRTDAQRTQLHDYFLERVCTTTRMTFDALHGQKAEIEKQLTALDSEIPKTMVMDELEEPKQAYLLIRGQYDQRGDTVERALPGWLPPLPAGEPKDRLGLARWLVRPEHPLTGRVAVNRFWQQIFGVGIVQTSEDFGVQGELPSHPKLLDWLTIEFRESGWDVKRLMKTMVTSSTYRQSARVSPELAASDPQNRLLARGPRFRMDAEMVRDTALFVSGLMVERIGGKGVKPYQPKGLWKAVGYTGSNTVNFVQDKGDALFRRSMYTFWKRTSPPPSMAILDAPTREACSARRMRTNTPLAALALLNDVQFVEAARHLAQRAMTEGGAKPEDRIDYMFRLATAREPSAKEQTILREQYDWQLKQFQGDCDKAEGLLTRGESPRDESLSAPHHAAWTMVANVVLNLDEVLNK